MFNNTLLTDKDIKVNIVEKVRAEEKSIIALENMLGYNISKLDPLENFFFQSKAYIERLKSG